MYANSKKYRNCCKFEQQKYNLLKKILLLSDTHSYIDDRILEYAQQADEIWHAGDIGDISVTDKLAKIKPLRAVYGNIDDFSTRRIYPENLRFTLEGVDVLMTHIGGYPGRYDPKIRQQLYSKPPKLFICGHSHILKVIYDKKLECLHMNPGAAGKYGFHQVRTLLRFVLDNGNIRDLEVIELGKRI